MQKIKKILNRFFKQMSAADCGFLKLCVCAVGVLIGLNVPKKAKKAAGVAAGAAFLITYIPIMSKLLNMLPGGGQGQCCGADSGRSGGGCRAAEDRCGGSRYDECQSDDDDRCRGGQQDGGFGGEHGCADGCCDCGANSIFEPEE